MMGASIDDVVKEMTTILPDVDKRVLLESDEMGRFMIKTFRKARLFCQISHIYVMTLMRELTYA